MAPTWTPLLHHHALQRANRGNGCHPGLVLDINALMVLATVGALAIGDYTEGAAIVVLFAIAAWLEAKCGRRAREAVSAVVAMQPATATLADSGKSRRLTLFQSLQK
ncbi:hypothetical protein ABBQ38_010808 [Trebouxia sp. C0009 RCD-2024]